MSTRTQALIVVIIILAIAYLFPVLFDLIVGEQTFIPLSSADTLPACLLPISLLQDGDFFLDEYAGWIRDNWGENPYFVRVINNHIVSAYPVVTAILSIPVYTLPVWAGWSGQPEQAFYLARISAGLLATLAMTIFYQICADRLDVQRSVLLTLALGLGSGMWTTVSQGLWQHTASIPFLFCAIWVLMRREDHPRCVPWVGFLLSMATIARYNNVTTAILLSVYVLFHCRSSRTAFLLLAAIPWIGFFLYNASVFGSPFALSYGEGMFAGWTTVWWHGLLGLFISPAKGLLVFSPFLLFALVENVRSWRFVGSLSFYVSLSCWIFALTVSNWWGWYGGWSFGNRMLTDTLPLWGMLLVEQAKRWSTKKLVLFGCSAGFAIFAHALGLFDYGVNWHATYDAGSASSAWLWDIKHSPIFFYAYHYGHRVLSWLS